MYTTNMEDSSTGIKTCCSSVDILTNLIAESGQFVNSSSDNLVRIEDFLKDLNLTEIAPVLMSFYREEWRYKLPPEAMLRAMIYFKLKGYKFLKSFWSDLATNKKLADALGFNDKIPSYQALWHFLNTRLGDEGVRKIFDTFLQLVKRELRKKGVKPGKEIGLDASPIEAPKTDKEAGYNDHYKIHGYFWHNLMCMGTDIPIDYQITSINFDEGYLLAPLLERAVFHGIDFEKVYIDGGYASCENIARVRVFFNAEVSCNIARNWIFRKDATAEEIRRWYRKMWKSDLYEKDANFRDMQLILMATEDRRFEQVGAYWRNEILLIYEESPDGYLDDYHTRNRIEGTHGVAKRKSNIRRMECKGIKRISTHIGMYLISKLAVALTRLQYSITEGLGNTAGLC